MPIALRGSAAEFLEILHDLPGSNLCGAHLAESVIGLFKAEVIRRKGPHARGRGIRDSDVGGLVQSPAVAGTDRPCAAGGLGARVPSSAKRVGIGSLTQTPEPPENSGRFIFARIVGTTAA